MTLKRFFLLIAIVLIAASAPRSQQRSREIENTSAILINKYMILSGDEALLITDPTKIKELVGLFRNNSTVGHACAFHWNIWFRQSPTESVPFSHNEDCEIYLGNNGRVHEVLKSYFNAVRQQPTHFLSNLRVAASEEPLEAAKKLEDDSHKVFFFRGTEKRLPYVRLQATSVSKMPAARRKWSRVDANNLLIAKGKLNGAIRFLQTHYAVVKATKLENRYVRSGGGTVEHRVDATIYFQFMTDIQSIQVPKGIEILEKKVPSDYLVQLVSIYKFSPDFRMQLMSNHPFVLDVFRFPEH